MADAKFAWVEARKRVFLALPQAIQDAAEAQLKQEADDMVAAIQRAMDAAYAGQNDKGLQTLRDSVHAYPNPHSIASYYVLADAKDAEGKFIGSNVEAGHLARDGSHVAPRPAFYSTYRARKRAMQNRLKAATRKAIKTLFPGD